MAAKKGGRPSQFMLGPSPRNYFNELEKSSETGKFKILLQKYWLCAQVGMAFNLRKQREEGDKWVADNIAPPLKENAHFLRGLLFFREAETKGYSSDDEKDMLDGMKSFFSDERQHKLNDNGLDVIDRYASKGFEIIQERIPNPTDLSSFLVDYVNLILEADQSSA